MILLLVACIWRSDAPVPPHADLAPVRAAFVDRDLAGLHRALEPWLQPGRGVRGEAGRRWSVTVAQATLLDRAEKPSERSTAYGRLVASCAGCHAGEPAPDGPVVGHGAALVALEEAVVHASASRGTQALDALGKADALPGSAKRFVQLAGRVVNAGEVPEAAHFLGLLYGECVRCHGPGSPHRLTGSQEP